MKTPWAAKSAPFGMKVPGQTIARPRASLPICQAVTLSVMSAKAP
jgi:hypothetical protein